MRTLAVTILVLFLALPAGALERAALPLVRQPGAGAASPPDFASGSSLTISYYNLCTGAVWYWSGVTPEATYGVRYDDIPDGSRLLRTHIYYEQGAPAGYGYTSLALILPRETDDCPALGNLGASFFTPASGWNTIEWNAGEGVDAGESFFVLVTHSPEPGDPSVIVTEKGDPSGARPGGCGTCYLPNRPIHSLQFGQEPFIVCPGAPWADDGDCPLELLWDSEFGPGTVAVETESWGRIKALWR